MKKLDLNRVERRYIVKDLDKFLDRMSEIGFEEKKFSDRDYTLTYFCDTEDMDMPKNERVKIRTYVKEIPDSIDFDADYKLNFKFHLKKSVSKKKSYKGRFDELLEKAKNAKDLDLKPILAMSYHRKHFTINENDDIRITIDYDIKFHKVEDGSLSLFHELDHNVVEIKLNADSEKAKNIEKMLLNSSDYQNTGSKKITMYKIYREKFID
jgi:hypothetical protein